jgi:hypothetical protein
MLWQVTRNLPTRKDYVEMLGRARATTAKALEEAKRTGNSTTVLLYQVQLVDWDRLIEQLREGSRSSSEKYPRLAKRIASSKQLGDVTYAPHLANPARATSD